MTHLVDDVKKRTANGTCPSCLTSQTLENQAKSGLSDLEIAYACSSPFGAGIETVSKDTRPTCAHWLMLLRRCCELRLGRLEGLSPRLSVRSSFYTHFVHILKGRSVAMLHFPEVMQKAQAEIDIVVGHDRMPEYDDYDNLPYVRAVLNEALRWRPVAVLGGTPHAVTADDVYNGM